MKYYAGVGSRETPADVLVVMTAIARKLAGGGWTLRSGHAQGADRAFEVGADGKAVIYLPWHNFGIVRYKEDPGMKLMGTSILRRDEWLRNYQYLLELGVHPGAGRESVKLLHGRNWCQVLGHDDEPPCRMVVCWCPEIAGEPQGGTATAVKLARREGIEVRNLWHADVREKAEAWLAT